MDFEKQFKNLTNLGKMLDELNILQNQAFDRLDPETYKHVKQYHIDINEVMRKFKEGDHSALSEYMKKYNKVNADNIKK